jgi:hypothetical protein
MRLNLKADNGQLCELVKTPARRIEDLAQSSKQQDHRTGRASGTRVGLERDKARIKEATNQPHSRSSWDLQSRGPRRKRERSRPEPRRPQDSDESSGKEEELSRILRECSGCCFSDNACVTSVASASGTTATPAPSENAMAGEPADHRKAISRAFQVEQEALLTQGINEPVEFYSQRGNDHIFGD